MAKVFDGLKFCITGALSRTRDEWTKIINENGGLVKSSVTSNLDYLIVGDEPGDTKLDAAQRFGIRTLRERDLSRLLTLHPVETEEPGKSGKRKKGKGTRIDALEM
jgi:DNA ligase (NAD+)